MTQIRSTTGPIPGCERHALGQRRRPDVLPSPEEVVLAWLLWLPPDADLATAALRELCRIELLRPTDLRHVRLAELFSEILRCAGTERTRIAHPRQEIIR